MTGPGTAPEPEEIRRSLYESAAKGDLEVVGEREGEATFSLTDQGEARVHDLVDEVVQRFAEELDLPVEIARGVVLHSLKARFGDG